jgi:hypothetical protein
LLIGPAHGKGERSQSGSDHASNTIEDTNALRAQFLQWGRDRSRNCILVSHGSPIEENPSTVPGDLAGSLT